ncbi:MAG: hypothetical protein M3R38_17050 [Actinomycetota bacterium]|nr:hypothetical protein [Actinomycetota bacterium]
MLVLGGGVVDYVSGHQLVEDMRLWPLTFSLNSLRITALFPSVDARDP